MRKNKAMICKTCHKKIKSKWVEVSSGREIFVMECGCKKNEVSKAGFDILKYREAVALGYDQKTGRPLAIDKKGKKFDIKETGYDLIRDPRGWKATGQKVRPFDKFGRPNR